MEINTSGAFATAAVSSLFGFGLAFFWFEKIKSETSTKTQRILLSIASISIGYGLTFILNEFIGFPLQGLSIRYEKIIGYFIVNVILLPSILGILIWLLQPKQSLNEELKESNKAHQQDAENITLVKNNTDNSNKKTIYEMFNEKNNSYESSDNSNEHTDPFADAIGIMVVVCAILILIISSALALKNFSI